MHKIYIAGPMSGYPNFNFEAFDRVETALIAAGFEVVNPARHSRIMLKKIAKQGRSFNQDDYRKVLRYDIGKLRECQGIYLLRGWERSYGAKRELCYALRHNKNVVLEPCQEW